jgi:hypothetical protein
VVQHRPDEVIARMEIDRDLTAPEESEMRAYFLRRLGPDVRVLIERVDEIPLTATGKYRRVVSTVPLNLGAGDIPNRFADAPILERGAAAADHPDGPPEPGAPGAGHLDEPARSGAPPAEAR